MAFEIVWSPNAEEDLHSVLNFLMEEWSDTFAETFSEKLFKVLNLLENHPYIGMTTDEFSSIRSIAVTRQYALYYMVLRNEVVIVNLLNNKNKK
ncbi:MAG: type II toxin-antitoxin system RelE/ParE family toxin [Runella slithyformis]|nr:MAG: type II toxin-antitoxin system RelE/ParE family toxin [Runella slithyformis]TAF29059.1 MAG: type II toxin-antitoxin system RelE/ParE family toxin [Runella slithyformis]TAF48749.1 MAG: type II toxin-antitoxin system RelE/ParE family toxin [Runella slithyformis]TAF78987.1 MAG: type II toxin-antitoxin system RelE/ParE family toxin [Runella slithyformis]